MITNFFIPELNNHDVQELWFQQDGATCHTARAAIDLLKDTFGDRLISRFGPVNWPPRSCDLTPLDYFCGAIRGLQYACETEVQFQDVWILTDSRASVQSLSNWTSIGNQTSLDILNLIDRISSNHCVHFQQVPSHVGIDGNEKADFLARTAAEEEVSPVGYLTFSELSSLKKIELHHLRRTSPSHPWYFGRNPGGSFKLMPRKYQSAFSRFVSGHIKALTFWQGQKIFPECHLCYSELVSPANILTCLNFKKD
ncbi:RNase H domain-containing protein [Trichonephila clavipes]|nr:RNase H domain-containing protein [Trichonephila clavipes]